MRANTAQSGSVSKSQWDLLFGSFQIIAASIMASRPSPLLPGRAARRIDRAVLAGGALRAAADEDLLLRVGHDLEAGAAQHRLRAGAVRNPPVRRVLRVAAAR